MLWVASASSIEAQRKTEVKVEAQGSKGFGGTSSKPSASVPQTKEKKKTKKGTANKKQSTTKLDPRESAWARELILLSMSHLPAQDEYVRRMAVVDEVEELARSTFAEGCDLHLHGSWAYSPFDWSDIDLCLQLYDVLGRSRSVVLEEMAAALRARGMVTEELERDGKSVLKFSDGQGGTYSMCVNNSLALASSQLLATYAVIDDRFQFVSHAVKHWARQRRLIGTSHGFLPCYAYMLMVVHFLQQRNPPVLPCLHALQPHTYVLEADGICCSFFHDGESLRRFGEANKESHPHLLVDFFDYWAFRHDYERSIVSVRTASFLSKGEKCWGQRTGNDWHLVSVEDPFDASKDVGATVCPVSLQVLRNEFTRAAKALHNHPKPLDVLFEPSERG